MKTPITYYGGKQSLAGIIKRLMPEHKVYCEPFVGGAAIFFSKEPSAIEIINDLNHEIINFYEVLKSNFDELASEIEISLYSRKLYKNARVVYENPDMFDRIKRAWAVWFLLATGYNSMPDSSFGTDSYGKRITVLRNKKIGFTKQLSDRLQNTRIECYDAVKAIKDNDSPETFFYIDPPYVGADQGHYSGYTQKDFDKLLQALSVLEGKFILSSYPNTNLSIIVNKNMWYQVEIEGEVTTSNKENRPVKTEVLTANYPISADGYDAMGLFDDI